MTCPCSVEWSCRILSPLHQPLKATSCFSFLFVSFFVFTYPTFFIFLFFFSCLLCKSCHIFFVELVVSHLILFICSSNFVFSTYFFLLTSFNLTEGERKRKKRENILTSSYAIGEETPWKVFRRNSQTQSSFIQRSCMSCKC